MRKEQSFILYILTALLALFLVSCSHTKYVEIPVETIKTEYIQQIKYDSIYSRDSIYIQSRGDTVYINKTNYKYKYLLRTDTVCKTDSVPYPVRVEVEREVNKMIKGIDKYINDIETNINTDSKKLSHFKSLDQYNETMSNILVNQNLIVLSIKENISAMLDVQNNLNAKIEYQNQDVYKIFINFNSIIKTKDELNDITKKIGSYSSFSHTDIEALSNIISTHRKKSSFTFAPIIALLKKS